MTSIQSSELQPFPLHSSELIGEGATPDRWMVILHGIYGRGANWRSFARALATRRPDWGFLLVDLRMHGQSQGAPGPHSLKACARDVLGLIDEKRAAGREVAAVLGHSYGGKVALEMLRQRESLGEVWVVDSSPSPRPDAMEDPSNTVVAVLRTLQDLPDRFEDRTSFVSELEGRGFPKALGNWLAMNLERSGDEYQLLLDPRAMEALLVDYFRADLWPVLEKSARPVHFAIATRSTSLSPSDESRLAELQRAGRVQATRVEGSHWLHVDALGPLVELVAASLD